MDRDLAGRIGENCDGDGTWRDGGIGGDLVYLV